MLILCGDKKPHYNALQDQNGVIYTFIHLHYCSKVLGLVRFFLIIFDDSLILTKSACICSKIQQNILPIHFQDF